MELHERIIAYVEKHFPSSMSVLEGIVLSKGFTLEQFYAALEKVHRDKRIIQTQRAGQVWYEPYIAPEIKPQPHLDWCKANYPWPGKNGVPEFIMPFPDWDLSWIFLSPEELEEFKAALKGTTYTPKKKYEHTRRQDTVRAPQVLTSAQRALLAQSNPGH